MIYAYDQQLYTNTYIALVGADTSIYEGTEYVQLFCHCPIYMRSLGCYRVCIELHISAHENFLCFHSASRISY